MERKRSVLNEYFYDLPTMIKAKDKITAACFVQNDE
jgi:hypothetical protein